MIPMYVQIRIKSSMSAWLRPRFSSCPFTEERPDCSKARCEVQFSPRCPEDSVLIEGYAPPGECCPLPSRCVCSPAGCLRKVCQPGYLNILVSKSSGKPGECCDLYECKPGKKAKLPPEDTRAHTFLFLHLQEQTNDTFMSWKHTVCCTVLCFGQQQNEITYVEVISWSND